MTNPTPRDSAQLPPLPEPYTEQVTEYSGIAVNRVDRFNLFTADQMQAYAREALRAQAASVPVGEVYSISMGRGEDAYACVRILNSAGITGYWDLPIREGGKLYAGAPPAHIPADVVPDRLIFSARHRIAEKAGVGVTAETNAVIAATLEYLRERASQFDLQAVAEGADTARAFIEWRKAQPEDRVPVSIDEALDEFEKHLAATKEQRS